MALSIRTSLVALFGTILLVGVGSILLQMHLQSSAQAEMQGLLATRLEPAAQLKAVSDLYAISIVDASHKAQNGNWGFADGLRSVRQASAGIATNWRAYEAGLIDPELQASAAETRLMIADVDRSVEKLTAILERGDMPTLQDYIAHELYQKIDPLTERIGIVLDGLVAKARTEVAAETEALKQGTLMLWGVLGLTLALACLGMWMVLARIAGPLRRLTESMGQVAAHRLDAEVPFAARRDELGAMAKALLVFRDNARTTEALRDGQETARLAADADRAEALRGMADQVERETKVAVDAMASHAVELDRSARALHERAKTMTTEAQSAGAATSGALSAAQTVASAAEELSASIREISHQVSRSTDLVRSTSDRAQQAETAIGSLAEAVNRINAVAGLIGEIAGQTNLLALNATIEAARAGEAGKGFAVVASEVKNLAAQTARSTSEISGQIDEIRSATDAAVEVVRAMADNIRSVDAISTSIAAAIEEQGAATAEIARSAQIVAQASADVTQAIGTVQVGIEETRGQGEDVRNAASAMANGIDTLRIGLVRAVRTSTADVNRRSFARTPLPVTIRIESRGRSFESRMLDISAGGAQVEAWPDVSSRDRVRISVPGVIEAVDAHVVSIRGERIGLAFDAGADEQLRIVEAVGRLAA